MPTETADAPPARSSFRDALASDVKTFVAETAPPKEAAATPSKETPPTAPPAATPPKVEAPATPDPDAEIDSGKRAPKSDDWKRVKAREADARKEADEFKGKVKKYESELAELRKRPAANSDEITNLKADYDKLKSQHEAVALEIMPEFQAKYESKLNKAADALKGVMDESTFGKVTSILQLPETEWKRKQLEELFENLSPLQQMKVGIADEKIREIISERDGELKGAREKLGEIVTSRTKQQQERAESMTKTFDEVFAKTQSENPMFKKREGDSKEVKEWNDGIAERADIARAMYSGQLDPSDMADAALRASSYHVAISELKSARQTITEKDAIIARLQGSGPAPNSGGGGDGATPKPVRGGFAQQITKDVSGG